jgi:hypothetical protein
MRAGLFRLGTDFGNGPVDARYFVTDDESDHYLSEKTRVLHEQPERLSLAFGDGARRANAGVLEWMREQVGTSGPAPSDLLQAYRELSSVVAEDFVVLARDTGGQARVTLVSVCFPSGWRPESILGLDFLGLHAPVPDFDGVARSASSLVEAMLSKGPYVRFVWTLSPDRILDHHPSQHRPSWARSNTGYLRVERQVTVPLVDLGACLFLIRTFCYPFATLTSAERLRLVNALSCSSDAVLRYKGLFAQRERIAGLLGEQGCSGNRGGLVPSSPP